MAWKIPKPKFWQGLSAGNAAGGAAVTEAVTDTIRSAGGATATGVKGAARGFTTVAGAAAEGMGKASYGAGYTMGRVGLKGPIKAAGIAGAVVAGVAALGIIASNMRKKRRYQPAEMEPLPPLDPMMPMGQEMGPAPGYQNNQWQNFVQNGRGGVQQQQQAGQAVNPNMSAVPGDSVQELGTPQVPTR